MELIKIITRAGVISQYERLFIRGNAISGTLQKKGNIIFPKPEIRDGIRKKKTITTA